MLRTRSDLARLTRVIGWKEAKLGMETVGGGEDVGRLVAGGVNVVVAILVGVIVAAGVEGIWAVQAVSRDMASSAEKINR